MSIRARHAGHRFLLLLLACCTSVLTGMLPAVAAENPPNIIFIMTDDQGYGDLACLGNPIIQTPHLDRLHDQSVRLLDYHVSPTCAPTRSALMTGRHEFRNGITHTILERERLTLKATTLPQILKTAGYTTGIFGKWHLGDEDAYQPGQRGFDEVFIHGAGGIGQTYPGSCGDAPGNSYFGPVIRHNGKFEKTDGYCTDVFFQQAQHWIDSVRGKQPFFAYIPTNAPHGPLDCPPEYVARYTGKVPANVAKFYGMITNIDDNIGRLMAYLAEHDLERNTLLIFQTDNGTASGHSVFNAGMRGQKATPFEGGTRVPAFWRWTGKLTPGDRPQLAAHIDVFPTLVEITGAKVPDQVAASWDGRSLWTVLQNPHADWPERTLFTHVGRWPHEFDPRKDPERYQFENCSVRRGKYELVFPPKSTRETGLLFDLEADPGQQKNIAQEHPEVVQQLLTAYDKWWAEVVPAMINENTQGPAMNPFHEAYWRQYQGPGPNNVAPPAGFLK